MTDHDTYDSCIGRCRYCWSFYDLGRDDICPYCGDDPDTATQIRTACEPV